MARQASPTSATLYGDPDAQAFFQNSRVPRPTRRKLVEKALAGVDPNVLNLALLCSSAATARRSARRSPRHTRSSIDARKGISHATVTSAVPLTADDVKAVEEKLDQITGGPVVVETTVDETHPRRPRRPHRRPPHRRQHPRQPRRAQAAPRRSRAVDDRTESRRTSSRASTLAWPDFKALLDAVPDDRLRRPRRRRRSGA